MAREQMKTLTEPMYYVLLALTGEQHGYGIMQSVDELTGGRVQVGAGTLYALLARFEGEGIIEQVREEERKKIYHITAKGTEVLMEEYSRLEQLVADGKKCFTDRGIKIPTVPAAEPLMQAEANKRLKTEKETEVPEQTKKKEKETAPRIGRNGILAT